MLLIFVHSCGNVWFTRGLFILTSHAYAQCAQKWYGRWRRPRSVASRLVTVGGLQIGGSAHELALPVALGQGDLHRAAIQFSELAVSGRNRITHWLRDGLDIRHHLEHDQREKVIWK